MFLHELVSAVTARPNLSNRTLILYGEDSKNTDKIHKRKILYM